MSTDLFVTRLKGRAENVADISISDDVRDNISRSCLKSLVSDILESHSGGVVRSSLFGVSDPESDVIKSIEDTNGGSLGRFSVINHT